MAISQDKYLAKAGNICPNCEGDNVEAERPEADGEIAWGKVKCSDCSATWIDQFMIVGFAELEVDEKA